MFAFPLSVCFWFLYIANMLLIYFCLAVALFGCSSSFCSLTLTPVQNPGACLGLSEVLTFSSPLQLLTALLLHWIKVSDLLCDALTRNISLIPAWKAARVEPGGTTHPWPKAEASADWKKNKELYYRVSASKLNLSTKAHTFYDTAYCLPLKSHSIFVVTSSRCGIMCGVNDAAMVIKRP